MLKITNIFEFGEIFDDIRHHGEKDTTTRSADVYHMNGYTAILTSDGYEQILIDLANRIKWVYGYKNGQPKLWSVNY